MGFGPGMPSFVQRRQVTQQTNRLKISRCKASGIVQELFKVEPGVGRLLGRVRLTVTAMMVAGMSPDGAEF